jgi:hypothetical protein
LAAARYGKHSPYDSASLRAGLRQQGTTAFDSYPGFFASLSLGSKPRPTSLLRRATRLETVAGLLSIVPRGAGLDKGEAKDPGAVSLTMTIQEDFSTLTQSVVRG